MAMMLEQVESIAQFKSTTYVQSNMCMLLMFYDILQIRLGCQGSTKGKR